MAKRSNQKVKDVKSELTRYLEEDVIPSSNDFDILSRWNAALVYSTLRIIDRDVLEILVSIVASESAFSTSGRVISQHRSRLRPNTVEALMCTQSWLWIERKCINI
ncbi:hypothetical protein M5689_011873 [Euphorbia peplus]|nr:hypothetical protein M5689_011873 [Euphorbia peplus]